ncbi:MAG: hypothetical protein M1436_07475 [Acidobacteria bacterium]|nr:hypothetical protein [Acidobacteriota bacterium]
MGSENQPLNTTTNQQQELPPTMRQDLEKERQTSARLLNDPGHGTL